MAITIGRRRFVGLVGGAAAWPLVARAQQATVPVVAFVDNGSADASTNRVRAFRKGLNETGYDEGRNVTIEYHWLDGQFDRLPSLAADLVRRRVAGIATCCSPNIPIAAKAATLTIPIIFSFGGDPAQFGLAASFNRPGGNATGLDTFTAEVVAKRLELLHQLAPKAVRVAVLYTPSGALAQSVVQDVQKAAQDIGLQTRAIGAGTSLEIDAAFATFARERPDALFVAPNAFYTSQRVQIATLAARERIPAAYGVRDIVAAGGLMSYGPDIADSYRQLGVYVGSVLNGAKPADLPILQPSKLELVINLKTAKALGLEVPPSLLAIADEVIE